MKVLVLSMLIGILIGTFCVLSDNFVRIFPHIRIVEMEIAPKIVTVEDEAWLESFVQGQPNVEVAKLICKTFGKDDCKLALAIARCESGLNPSRVGDKTLTFWEGDELYGASYGVFQIRHLRGRPAPEQLKDPKFNVEYAYRLYKDQGFQPWSCYIYNGHERYL